MRPASLLPSLAIALIGVVSGLIGHLKLVSEEAAYSYRTVDAGMFYLMLGVGLVIAAALHWRQAQIAARHGETAEKPRP